jgi:DNA polymerase III subunit epsilon
MTAIRQIFLDTETTGIHVSHNHRIIEIAAVELINRRPTKKRFHAYIDPERSIDPGAQEVHGITSDFLQGKPKFSDVYEEMIAFISGAELIIHNAPFDVGFLNMELAKVGKPEINTYVDQITDTLAMARKIRPGQRNNLDALCKNFGINNAKRVLHGALLDAELLSEVYIAMTRGQDSLFSPADLKQAATAEIKLEDKKEGRPALKVLLASPEELSAHNEYIKSLTKAGAKPW